MKDPIEVGARVVHWLDKEQRGTVHSVGLTVRWDQSFDGGRHHQEVTFRAVELETPAPEHPDTVALRELVAADATTDAQRLQKAWGVARERVRT